MIPTGPDRRVPLDVEIRFGHDVPKPSYALRRAAHPSVVKVGLPAVSSASSRTSLPDASYEDLNVAKPMAPLIGRSSAPNQVHARTRPSSSNSRRRPNARLGPGTGAFNASR